MHGKRGGLDRIIRFLRSRRVWRWVGLGAAGIIVLQLLLPYNRAFVLDRIDGVPVGLKTTSEITAQMSSRYDKAVVVTTQPDTTTPFADAGVKVDSGYTAERITNYPVWQRLIPLSLIVRLFDTTHVSKVNYLKLPSEEWAESVSAKCRVAARDASVEITGGKLTLSKSANGSECSRSGLLTSLKAAKPAERMAVNSGKKTIQPKRSDAAVSAQIKKIQSVIDDGVTVTVLGTTTRAEPAEIVGWLTFSDGEAGQLKLDVDPAKLQPFVARVQQPVYVAPGTTTVTVRDGQETGRVAGASGQGVDGNDLIAQLRSQLTSDKTIVINGKVTALAPRLAYQRSYTNSTPGLQALIQDIANEKPNMAIAITELDGQRRSLSANGDRTFHPASTYKLFIAYGVIKRVESNQLKWTDSINGSTVDECLTRMIVNSDNACAEAFGAAFGGWGGVQKDVKATGATGTNLNLPEPVATVKDQVLFLQKLQGGQLMKTENRDKLLALMKRQQYRAGIPSGVKFEVADKVGFLAGNLHDSGLVYASHGVYALSIYSTGGTWGDLADAARRIEALLAS